MTGVTFNLLEEDGRDKNQEEHDRRDAITHTYLVCITAASQ